MIEIILALIVFVCAGAYALPRFISSTGRKKIRPELYYIILMLAAAAGIRIFCALLFTGHKFDMSCFRSWASRLASGGPAKFYASDGFNNYPPGYMYILWLIGKINSVMKLDNNGFNFLLKLPVILADLICGCGVYRLAMKRSGIKTALIAAALWLFNPAVIINSSLWGQVDAVYTIVLGLMLYFISTKRLIPAYFAFAAAILLKPQSFVLTPILIFGIIEQVFLCGFDNKVFFKNLAFGLGAIATMFLICLPFGIEHVIKQYTETLQGNPYFSQNAFNMWGVLGNNYRKVTAVGSIIGYILMALSVALTAFVYFRSKNDAKVYFCGGLIILCFYMLSVKVNERYAFAAILFFLLAFAQKDDLKNYVMTMLITLSQFFNMAWVLFIFETDNRKYFFDPWIPLYSGINIPIFIFILYIAFTSYISLTSGKKILCANKKGGSMK